MLAGGCDAWVELSAGGFADSSEALFLLHPPSTRLAATIDVIRECVGFINRLLRSEATNPQMMCELAEVTVAIAFSSSFAIDSAH